MPDADWEEAKKLLESEKVSLQVEAERAADAAQKMVNTKKELFNFLNGVLIACIVAADIYSPGHSTTWSEIRYRVRNYKVRFGFFNLPYLLIKRRGTILQLDFEYNKTQKVYLTKALDIIDYDRLSELSELISIFEKDAKETSTILKARES
jgi:hypothetical protein